MLRLSYAAGNSIYIYVFIYSYMYIKKRKNNLFIEQSVVRDI